MDEEAARLGHDPQEQEQSREPLDPDRVPGTVEVEEVDQREHQQHSGMGVPCPEELLSELPELATSGEKSQ